MTPRRAHELAVKSLEIFHRENPSTEIHFFGYPAKGLTFPVTHHGLLSPAELGVLYSKTLAGLVLSATNVSLVPLEMLSAGCIPVMNDAPQNRIVLDNPQVRYAVRDPFPSRRDFVHHCAFVAGGASCRSAGGRQGVSLRSWASVESGFEATVRAIVAARTGQMTKV